MEILQQFYIAVEDPKEGYELFPGDQYKLSVKCKRCHKCVSSPNQGILETISSAPVAMLRHWNIISTHDDSTKKVVSTCLPLLFSSQDAYESSKKKIEASLDKSSDILRYPYFCSKKRYGEFNFCEAVKADISIQRAKQSKEQNYENTITNTFCLVKTLFEDLDGLIDYIQQLTDKTLKHRVVNLQTLFNNVGDEKKEAAYMFEQFDNIGVGHANSPHPSLKMFESWCLFFHRLVNNNQLGVLWQFHNSVHEPHEPMSPALLKRMNFSGYKYKEIHGYIKWHLEKYNVPDRYGWVSLLDNKTYYVPSYYDCQPNQFQFGQLSTMSSIYDMKGKGVGTTEGME